MTIAISLLVLSLCTPAEDPAADWTILYYGASDNDSEQSFCPDIEELRAGIAPDANINVLALVDRSPRYSSTSNGFGEDFADTRLYELTPAAAVRRAGGDEFPEITVDSQYEANTGDAHTVRKALRWARENYPAKRQAVIFYSHGDGPLWCPDEGSDGDRLYTAELTDVLTEEDSVDLIVFDVCLMSGIENAYQWRPGTGRFSTDVMVATPMAGFPFPWQRVLRRMRPGEAPDGAPAWLDPATLTAADFGRLVVEETEGHRRALLERDLSDEMKEHVEGESMTCIDLSAVATVKEHVDALARELGSDTGRELYEAARGSDGTDKALHYSNPAGDLPYFDLYDLARRLAAHQDADGRIRGLATKIVEAVDKAVLASYGLAGYDAEGGFLPGQHGIYIVSPVAEQWRGIAWYHPQEVKSRRGYGRYAWCADGAIPANDQIDNWFELLDAWYDDYDEEGGANGYRW